MPTNQQIQAKEVRLVAADGEQVGVVDLAEALAEAEESQRATEAGGRTVSPPWYTERKSYQLLPVPIFCLFVFTFTLVLSPEWEGSL